MSSQRGVVHGAGRTSMRKHSHLRKFYTREEDAQSTRYSRSRVGRPGTHHTGFEMANTQHRNYHRTGRPSTPSRLYEHPYFRGPIRVFCNGHYLISYLVLTSLRRDVLTFLTSLQLLLKVLLHARRGLGSLARGLLHLLALSRSRTPQGGHHRLTSISEVWCAPIHISRSTINRHIIVRTTDSTILVLRGELRKIGRY